MAGEAAPTIARVLQGAAAVEAADGLLEPAQRPQVQQVVQHQRQVPRLRVTPMIEVAAAVRQLSAIASWAAAEAAAIAAALWRQQRWLAALRVSRLEAARAAAVLAAQPRRTVQQAVAQASRRPRQVVAGLQVLVTAAQAATALMAITPHRALGPRWARAAEAVRPVRLPVERADQAEHPEAGAAVEAVAVQQAAVAAKVATGAV